MIKAVFDNLAGEAKDHFTVGIIDDIKHSNVEVNGKIDVADPSTSELLFFGLGGDGMVGACKNISKIVGDYTDLYAQSYAAYDSKKSGGSTRLHLRFSKNPIRSTYLVNQPHTVVCSNDAYLQTFDMIDGLRQNGLFLLNTACPADKIDTLLPNKYKRLLAEKNAKLYIIDAAEAAVEAGFRRGGKGVNTIIQSAFFKLNEQIMSFDEAKQHMKEFATKTYAKKGEKVISCNHAAVDLGGTKLVEVPVNAAWASLKDEEEVIDMSRPKFVREIADPINKLKGDELPLSVFKEYVDASMPQGTANLEKRGVSSLVPTWDMENCIQCNKCSFACPHAAIRPFLLNEEEVAAAPDNVNLLPATGKALAGLKFTIAVSTLDCTGCGVCITVCPGKKGQKALSVQSMHQARENKDEVKAEYLYNKVSYKGNLVGKTNAKNVQFSKPLFEFSGACGGCGETPYVKAVSQLFGDRMIVANATGCSSIYSGSYPSSPYTTDENGRGPAWANSLFEDNAEFGFGMFIGYETLRDRIQNVLVSNYDAMSEDTAAVCKEWVENRYNGEATKELAPKVVAALESTDAPFAKEVLELKDYLVKTSQWIIGGDGWAYDIGFGGLDQVIASGEDVNILVLDTEVYSNTGGQSSKSSRTGSIAKFTAAGKRGKKKDLASIVMTYGNVYVASVCHGDNQNQVIKALREAEAYKGPSVVICYSPCIAHNIKGGLYNAQLEAALATECGYWPTFRFNPELKAEGKNPFVMDSKEPNWDKYQDFLLNEGRYAHLSKVEPEKAEALLAANKEDAQERYARYAELAAKEF